MELEQFLNYLSHEKRYSSNTLLAYETDLNQFSEFLNSQFEERNLLDASHQIIRSWVLDLLENQIEVSSVRRKVSTLRSFYKYHLTCSNLKINPMVKIISPKMGKKLPSFLKIEEIKEVFEEVEFENGFSGIRDRLVLDVFYQTGIRVSELIGLKESDVNFNSNSMKVLGKRNKERIIPISEKLKKDISVYINIKNLEFQNHNKCLFVLDNGNILYRKFVYNKVKYYINQVSSLNKKSPHILRHTFATHMLMNGADLNAIKEILGHSSLAATQVYAHNSLEQLKEVHKLAHPRNKNNNP